MSEVAYIGPGGRPRLPRPLLRTLVGHVLRRNRLAQRRTLAEVARDARVSLPYLSEVERGRKEASSEVLAAVCDALRIELSDLLAEVPFEFAGGRSAHGVCTSGSFGVCVCVWCAGRASGGVGD